MNFEERDGEDKGWTHIVHNEADSYIFDPNPLKWGFNSFMEFVLDHLVNPPPSSQNHLKWVLNGSPSASSSLCFPVPGIRGLSPSSKPSMPMKYRATWNHIFSFYELLQFCKSIFKAQNFHLSQSQGNKTKNAFTADHLFKITFLTSDELGRAIGVLFDDEQDKWKWGEFLVMNMLCSTR